MTGQQLQDALDALVRDLQTTAKGRSVQIPIRDDDNNINVYTLSSDANGVVNAAQLTVLQEMVDSYKPVADAYETARAPVTALSEAFKTAQAPHEGLITAAKTARTNLETALEGDANYQAAKTALDNARSDPAYQAAIQAYKDNSIADFAAQLRLARGEYA
jgi:hypothetical protein